MTKLQRDKAEMLLLKEFIKTNPQVKVMLDELLEISKDGVKAKDIVEPVIKEKLKEARMIGVNIGWQAAFLRCEEATKNMEHSGQIKAYIHEEANKVREILSISQPNNEQA